jgi:hypothetical protein
MSEEVKKLEMLSLPDNNFINSYEVGYNLVTEATNSHEGYWKLIKACQEHISGKKPVPPDELKKKGLGWVYNFNYNKARAKIEKGSAENVSKVSTALSLGYCTFRNFKDEDRKDKVLSFLEDENKRGIAASVIGYALYNTLSNETRLAGWLNEIEYPAYAFGYCALVTDKFDWIPTPTHPLNIAFKPNTKPEKIEVWVTYDLIEASELYKRWVTAKNESIQQEQGIKKRRITSSGWSLEGLEKILLKAFQGKVGENKTPESWEEVVPLYRENASSVISNTESVSIAKIFYKELNGTLSEIYIPWDNAWQITKSREGQTVVGSENQTNNIIFSKNHGTYEQKNHINLIRDSGFTSEAGCIQDLRGIAKFAVEDSIRYNRLRNGIGNKMQFVGSPMFEQPHSQTGEQFKITVSQGFVLLPQSHNLVEKQPSFDISSHINVLRFEEGEHMRDTQQYDATIQGRLTSRPNKGEVQRVTEEVEFTDSAKNNIKFRDYASVFLSVLTRMPKVKCKKGDIGFDGRKKFYETIKKNLPWLVKEDEDVNKLLSCIDSFMLLPVVASIETITIAIQMAETPMARNRLKRMLLVAKGFPIEEVNIAVPLIADKFTNFQDDRIAAFENDLFFTTNEIILSGTDDHIVHIESHIAKNGRVIKGANEGALSPVDAFKFLENCLLHCIRHNEMLGADPVLNSKAQEYGEIIAQQMKAKDAIKSAAERMMQEQQARSQQVQIDPETQAKIASDAAKAQADTARKDWLAERRTEQTDKKIDLSHEQQLRKIELERELKQYE